MRVRDGGVQAGATVAMGRVSVAGAGRSRVGARIALVAALALPVVASSEAAAQSASASASSAKTAGEFFEEGTKAASAGRWEEARKAFTEAWKLKQHWQIAAHLGRAELMAGRHRDAAEHLSYFLREAKGVSDADRKQTQEMLDQALTKVGAVTVNVNVAGAEVLVDGRVVGRSPIEGPVFVEPGKRTFKARRAGYADVKVTKEVKRLSTLQVDLSLAAIVGTDLDAQKGRVVSTKPMSVESVRKSYNPRAAIVVAGSGLAGAFLVAGVVFAGLSQSKANQRDDDLKAAVEQDTRIEEDRRMAFRAERIDHLDRIESQRLTLAGLSLGSFVGAGLVAGGAVIAYVLITPSKAVQYDTATMQLTLSGTGALVSGRW